MFTEEQLLKVDTKFSRMTGTIDLLIGRLRFGYELLRRLPEVAERGALEYQEIIADMRLVIAQTTDSDEDKRAANKYLDDMSEIVDLIGKISVNIEALSTVKDLIQHADKISKEIKAEQKYSEGIQ